MTLAKVLLQGPEMGVLVMSEVPVYYSQTRQLYANGGNQTPHKGTRP